MKAKNDKDKLIKESQEKNIVLCEDCFFRDPKDHKCNCDTLEHQGCDAPMRDDFYCADGERRYKTHIVKILPEYIQPVIEGKKNFEIRYNDRRYHVGDTLVLREWNPVANTYTGRECTRKIIYVFSDVFDEYLQPGYVVLGLDPVIADGRNDESMGY